jgi:branched-subunit amino acid transport protein
MSTTHLAMVVLAAAAGTYLWRGLGVMLSGRVSTSSPLFEWVGCVAYAMIAGLVVRIVVLPTGTLATVPLADRLLVCTLAYAVYRLTRRNLFLGVGTGFAAIVALQLMRA